MMECSFEQTQKERVTANGRRGVLRCEGLHSIGPGAVHENAAAVVKHRPFVACKGKKVSPEREGK